MKYLGSRILGLLVLLLLLMSLTACGSSLKSSNHVDKVQGAYKGQELAEYNMYINFSNHVNSEFLEAKANYFAYFADDNLNYIKQNGTKEIVISRSEQTHQCINDLNEILGNTPSLSLEKTTQNLLPEVKAEIEILDEMADYYGAKEYTKDHFEKGKKLHAELLKTNQTTNNHISKFNTEFDKVAKEQDLAEMEELKKNGDMVSYVFADFILKAEAVKLELEKQNMNAANILKLDTCAYCLKYDELVNSYNELERVTKDEEQLDNSGITAADITAIKAKATKVEGDAESILDRVQSKDDVEEYALGNVAVLEKIIGTPEKLAKSFKELDSEYTNFIALK
ncbi:hypothetical protein C1910_05185 [Listeria ivanovii]|uniref:DUF3829 domain-containing protein n=1 Tax=Listeria ivanovii TaxID=1638 RepID=UPI000DAA21B6|nr:DUF3829 domain-containing protein [Listeria ivanovii]PZG39274.1 hypothetical protein C1910_05185 [Listeria ivanovii]